jgi:hypothetical protein
MNGQKRKTIDDILEENKACIHCAYLFNDHKLRSFDVTNMLAFLCPNQKLENGKEVFTYVPGDNLDIIEQIAKQKGLV